MEAPSRTTTIQITLLNDGPAPLLRGRIRLAGGVTLPFVGTRELVTHLRTLLDARAQAPPQLAADAAGTPVKSSLPYPEATQE